MLASTKTLARYKMTEHELNEMQSKAEAGDRPSINTLLEAVDNETVEAALIDLLGYPEPCAGRDNAASKLIKLYEAYHYDTIETD